MNIAAMNGGVPPTTSPNSELAPLNQLSGSLSNFNLIDRLNKNSELAQQLNNYCMHGLVTNHASDSDTNDESEDKDGCFQFKIGKSTF